MKIMIDLPKEIISDAKECFYIKDKDREVVERAIINGKLLIEALKQETCQEFKVKRIIPAYMANVEGTIEHAKQLVAETLFEGIKENITYKIDAEPKSTSITASIFIGKKEVES